MPFVLSNVERRALSCGNRSWDARGLRTGVPRSLETTPPWGHHMALGIVLLLKGPRGALFLMSEVPL